MSRSNRPYATTSCGVCRLKGSRVSQPCIRRGAHTGSSLVKRPEFEEPDGK